ncbi:MAG: PLDc N-terminal domain-containing protein [Propionibacteriaceae bacterium]|nr:PLDc N-terminal domain-containing protein [Propionibacteriaceae bacterium]
MNSLMDLLPVIIPLAIIQVGLMVAALIHILTHSSYKMGNRILWIVVVIVVNTIGPILYFVLGRSDEERS